MTVLEKSEAWEAAAETNTSPEVWKWRGVSWAIVGANYLGKMSVSKFCLEWMYRAALMLLFFFQQKMKREWKTSLEVSLSEGARFYIWKFLVEVPSMHLHWHVSYSEGSWSRLCSTEPSTVSLERVVGGVLALWYFIEQCLQFLLSIRIAFITIKSSKAIHLSFYI